LFQLIAEKSLEGTGCNQIKNILINARTLPEPLWWAGLNIAYFCDDGETAIHTMSEDHDDYTPEATVRKVHLRNSKATGPITCTYFASLDLNLCDGCKHRGKITTPKQLGRQLKIIPIHEIREEETEESDTVRTAPVSQSPVPVQKITVFPTELHPFVRGVNGGVYYIPPPKVDKKGNKHQDDPIQLSSHDVYPIKRMYSPLDGECLTVRNIIPHDPIREFILPMKCVYAQEKLREILAANSVFFNPSALPHFMNYFVKWGQHLLNTEEAEQMRMQMGWTDSFDAFVIGNKELRKDGTERPAPASPYVRGLAKLLKPEGSYEKWKEAAQALNQPEFEMHAFVMMCGFASPLMRLTSTSGVTIALTGESGAAKTGAMYGALSAFGHPKDLSVVDATDNGLVGRYLALHSLMFGLDEVSNYEGEAISNIVHKISHGKAKIKMQASVNAERTLEMSASLIGVMTSNGDLYDKLSEFKDNPNGEAARLINFYVNKPAMLRNNPRFGTRVFNTFRTNYGWAGPEFIRHFFNIGEDAVLEKGKVWADRFLADFSMDNSYRFYENLVQSVFAAGEMLAEADIVHYDLDRIYRVIINEMISIKDKTIKLNYTDYKALLGEFINKHHAGALVLNNGKVTTEPRFALVMRMDVQTQMCYISKTEFKKYLGSKQISSRAFETALEDDGILVYNGKQRLSNGWKAGMTTPPIAVYGFKTEIPEELFRDNDEQV
jgi:hypothetical protein